MEQPSNTICGQGYVYMGPLTPEHYEIQSDVIHEKQCQFKVMLLGDSGVGECSLEVFFWRLSITVGKTCLLIRFNDETFPSGNFLSTVGIDYRNKTVTLGDKKINLQIFDTVSKSIADISHISFLCKGWSRTFSIGYPILLS